MGRVVRSLLRAFRWAKPVSPVARNAAAAPREALTRALLLVGLVAVCPWCSCRPGRGPETPVPMDATARYARVTDPGEGAEDCFPIWGTAGRVLYFERTVLRAGQASSEIRRLDLRTGQQREVARGMEPALSPDGRRMAYCSIDNGELGPIEITDLQTGSRTRLPNAGEGIRWSPDGGRLLYVRPFPRAIRVLDLKSQRETIVGKYPVIPSGHWSPDGRMLAYVDEDRKLHLLDWVGGRDRTIGTLKVAPSALGASAPWSPDGKALALAFRTAVGGARVFRVDAATGELHTLTAGPSDKEAAWAPDGARIAYTRYAGEGKGKEFHVGLMDLATRTERVFAEQSLRGPVWSPDSGRVACVAMPKDTAIWVISVHGGEPARN